MARAKKKTSSSDLATRKPISGKTKIGQHGAQGAAYAAVIIQTAEAAAQAEEQVRVTMKDRLRELVTLGRDEQVAFRATLEVKREEIKAAAGAAKLGVADFLAAHPVENSVYVTLALWQKLSLACEAGFAPNYGLPWAAISKAATDHNASKGKPSNDLNNPQPVGPTARKQGRKPQDVVDKVKTFVKANLLTQEGTTKPKEERKLADLVAALCDKATLEELREVASRVQRMLDAAEKAQTATGKALESSKAAAKNKRTGAAKPVREHAAAKK